MKNITQEQAENLRAMCNGFMDAIHVYIKQQEKNLRILKLSESCWKTIKKEKLK